MKAYIHPPIKRDGTFLLVDGCRLIPSIFFIMHSKFYILHITVVSPDPGKLFQQVEAVCMQTWGASSASAQCNITILKKVMQWCMLGADVIHSLLLVPPHVRIHFKTKTNTNNKKIKQVHGLKWRWLFLYENMMEKVAPKMILKWEWSLIRAV